MDLLIILIVLLLLFGGGGGLYWGMGVPPAKEFRLYVSRSDFIFLPDGVVEIPSYTRSKLRSDSSGSKLRGQAWFYVNLAKHWNLRPCELESPRQVLEILSSEYPITFPAGQSQQVNPSRSINERGSPPA